MPLFLQPNIASHFSPDHHVFADAKRNGGAQDNVTDERDEESKQVLASGHTWSKNRG
jgi:hypothetical protein